MTTPDPKRFERLWTEAMFNPQVRPSTLTPEDVLVAAVMATLAESGEPLKPTTITEATALALPSVIQSLTNLTAARCIKRDDQVATSYSLRRPDEWQGTPERSMIRATCSNDDLAHITFVDEIRSERANPFMCYHAVDAFTEIRYGHDAATDPKVCPGCVEAAVGYVGPATFPAAA